MIHPEIKKKLIDDVNHLPFDLQKKVREFAHALVVSREKGTPGNVLARFSGVLSKKDARLMREAISEECERVDRDEW